MRGKAAKLLEDIEANKLPSLPHILVKLLQACRSENISFDTLSEIISQDASLSTRVIKAANSPVYGRARNLNSLKHTLMFLGLNTIKSIAITASIKQFFSEYSNQKTSFLKDFWHHSLTCATIARSLAELTSYPYVEEAYIAGLLHDIGKLMLEPKMDADYKTCNHGTYPAEHILKKEEEAFDISHPELAAIILGKWNMPDVVCDAVRYHHADTDEIQQAHQLAKIIHFASLLACDFKPENQSIKTEAGIRLFDLSESIVDNIVKKAREETQALATSMDIDIGDTDTSLQKDEIKQIQLAQEIRDTALVQNSQACISIDSDEIFKSIQQSISLLFGINNSLMLCIDDTRQYLTIADHQYLTDTHLFDDLKVNIHNDCIISRSIKQRQLIDSFTTQQSGTLSILDKQIAHGLKTDGFISIPVAHTDITYGVVLLGVNQQKSQNLVANDQLLQLFAANLACKLHQHIEYNNKVSEITEHKNEQFMHRARQVVHETNNPLTVIRNYLQLLSNRLDNEDPAQEDIGTIKHEIDRIANIITRCQDTPEADNSELLDLNLNTLVKELIDIYKASLFSTHNIKSALKLDEDLNPIQSDKDIIKQIMTNLVKNSVEAIDNNGEIIITTGNININGKNYVELKLQDTGPGIPEDIMKNLYKPVTTTKGKSHSGLGLSITKNLVDRIGGSISCRTSETGTTFSIQFPEIIKRA